MQTPSKGTECTPSYAGSKRSNSESYYQELVLGEWDCGDQLLDVNKALLVAIPAPNLISRMSKR